MSCRLNNKKNITEFVKSPSIKELSTKNNIKLDINERSSGMDVSTSPMDASLESNGSRVLEAIKITIESSYGPRVNMRKKGGKEYLNIPFTEAAEKITTEFVKNNKSSETIIGVFNQENNSSQQAQQLYAQYLQRNPNGSVEQFKSWFDNNQSNVQYQLPQGRELEEFVASEKTIRDLAARMSDRIGIPIRFESDRTKEYKGKLENGTAVINLAYATLDTPIHEILGHPIIRAIKNKSFYNNVENSSNFIDWVQNKEDYRPAPFMEGIMSDEIYKEAYAKYGKEWESLNKPLSQLYQNLLKELEYSKGKEVFDRIKRDYRIKDEKVGDINESKKQLFPLKENGYEYKYYYNPKLDKYYREGLGTKEITQEEYLEKAQLANVAYTLEEQQEEALVELLGLYTAGKLDKVKDGKLISLFKRLLKEMKAFMKQLLGQKEVNIDSLPDNMTLGDIADLLAYSNSKLILPGNEVVYTTPDNRQFKTYAEASNHISELAKSVEDVDLSDISIDDIKIDKNNLPSDFKNYYTSNRAEIAFMKDAKYNDEYNNKIQELRDKYAGKFIVVEKSDYGVYPNTTENQNFYNTKEEADNAALDKSIEQYKKEKAINGFIEKNKEYAQSREIIEEWKKVNNIQYIPEEAYSRGQEFIHVHNAYGSVDTRTWLQNLIPNLEDINKANGVMEMSFLTYFQGKLPNHVTRNINEKAVIKIIAYPKSKDIAFASKIDNDTSSYSRALEGLQYFIDLSKVSKREQLAVNYTKSVRLSNINTIEPNIADTIDDVAHHNEYAINIADGNFRIEYGEETPYDIKKLVDSINSILDQKHGKLVKPEINNNNKKELTFDVIEFDPGSGEPSTIFNAKSKEEADSFIDSQIKQFNLNRNYYKIEEKIIQQGIQPTQTNETLKESIESVGSKLEEQNYNEFGGQEAEENMEFINPKKHNKKEYTEQALINTKIAKLKEVAKKYPRSLIRSEVKRINTSASQELYDQFGADELPFQKVSDSSFQQFQQSLNKPNTNPALQGNQKPDVILPIGTSGSGKSTFIKTLPQENLVVIEPDAMRVEFTGDMNDKSKDKEIYIEAAKRAIQAIEQGKQVVFDTTNLTKEKRLPFIEAIKKAIPTANIQYKLMELNPELAKQRIKADIAAGKNRANVPDATIDRHAESYKQMLEDIKSEPISNFDVQEEQAKKFAELQERLNNKEFLEGAKNAFESSEELQKLGTQEQYNDFIARVSLGIIKNPTSGEYNYESQVKDIVYHGTNAVIESFDKNKIASNTLNYGFYGKGFYFNETKNDLIDWWKVLYKKTPNIITAIINTRNPYKETSTSIEEKTKLGNKQETEDFTNDLLEKNYDSVLPQIPKEEGSNEYVVFEPEQIHILSSKSDIQGFKDFMTFEKHIYYQLPDKLSELNSHSRSLLNEDNFTNEEVQQAERGEEIKPQGNAFYNLRGPDRKRSRQIRSLKNLLIRQVKKLTVTIKTTDPTTGAVTSETKPITVKTLQEYANIKSAQGESIGSIGGIAHLLDRIVAYTEEDGVTSAEEIFHFLLLTMHDGKGNLDADLVKILTMKDPADNIPFFKKTQPYIHNFQEYLEKYQNEISEEIEGLPLTAEKKAELEILAKLLAQYMYDKQDVSGLRNTLAKAFNNFINFFLSKFGRTINLWQRTLSEDNYPIEYRKALEIFDKKVWTGEYIQKYENNLDIVVQSKHPTTAIPESLSARSNLDKAVVALKNMSKRIDQLIHNSPVTGKDYKEYTRLFTILGLAQTSKETVRDLTEDKLDAYEEKLDKELSLNPTDIDLLRKKEDFNKLRNHFNNFSENSERVNQLYSVENRIASIKRNISLRQYEEGLNIFLFGTGNMKDAKYGDDYDYNQYGAIYDAFKGYSKVMRFMGRDEEGNPIQDTSKNLISTVTFKDIAEIKELYNSLSGIVNILLEEKRANNDKLFENDDERNKRVDDALELMFTYLNEMNQFLLNQDVNYYARRNTTQSLLEPHGKGDQVDEFVSREHSKVFNEILAPKLWAGRYGTAGSDHLRNFTNVLKGIERRIEKRNYDDSVSFMVEIKKMGYDTLSLKEKNQIPYQLDEKGNQTHYMNSKYDTAGWVKSQEEFRDRLPAKLQKWAESKGFTVRLDQNYHRMMEQLNIVYTLETKDKDSIPDYLKELWQIRDEFGKEWQAWHKANSVEMTEAEANAYLEDLKQKVPFHVYKKIKDNSIREYVDFGGNIVEYYTGPLIRPKKLNPHYAKLSATQQRIADYWRESIMEQKFKNNPQKFSYEWMNRAPQITKTTMDSITGKGIKSTIKYKFKTIAYDRVDDEIYNIGENGKVIRFPPLRFNKKISDPNILTNDFPRAFALYAGNANHRAEFIPHLTELQGMIDVVTEGDVSKRKYRGIGPKELVKGSGSNLEKAMNHLLDSIVFGNTVTNKHAVNTFLVRSKKYLQNNMLVYNLPSLANAWASAEIDKIVFGAVDDLYNMKERQAGYKRIRKELSMLVKDIENPINHTLLGALSVRLGVGTSVSESMSLTNINRSIRIAKNLVEPFSGWRVGEIALDIPLIAIVNEGIRLVDGKWMTRQGYESEVVQKARGQAKKDAIQKWDEATTVMDNLSIKDGKIDESKVPPKIMKLFEIRAIDAINQIDQKLTPSDRGTIYRSPIASLLFTFMPWFILQTEKWFQSTFFNTATGQWESGVYSIDSLKFYKDFAAYSLLDLIKSLTTMTLSFESVKLLLDTSIDEKSEAYIRNSKRVAAHMVVTTILSLLGYLLMGISLRDEDDDDPDPWLQFVALLLQKMRTEQLAKISLGDAYSIVRNPTMNFENSLQQFEIIDVLWEHLFPGDEDDTYKKDTIYEGMNKRTVSLIRLLPYTKGLFENYFGWYLNPKMGGYLEGRPRDLGRSFSSKKNTLIQYVVDPNPIGGSVGNAFDSFGFPAKVVGHTSGRFFLKMIDNPYYENKSKLNINFPDRKSNKAHVPKLKETKRQKDAKKKNKQRKKEAERRQKNKG